MKKKSFLAILLFVCAAITACSSYEVQTVTTKSSLEEILEAETRETTMPQTKFEITEEDYKLACRELFYDDIFFGENNLESHYVKLNLLLSEKYYFTNSDMHKDSYIQYDEKYNLNKDFYKCCVLRKGTDSYVGQQINMWFSDDFQLDPNDYEIGQKIIVYAEVISWSNNTMDGYNKVTIVPKYIETEQ